MWTCPKCKREFKNRNQDHSCGDFSIKGVFAKYPEVFPLFEEIRDIITSFGDVKIIPLKNAVMFTVQTNFTVLKPHRNYMIVEFVSTKSHDEFPVEKCVKISKIKYAHILKIDSLTNIDDQLGNWLHEAHLTDNLQ